MPLHLLYLHPYPNQEAFVEPFKQMLQAHAYHLYDPFGLLPGKTYPHTVKLFVAPSHQEGWVALISEHELSEWLPAWGSSCIALLIDTQSAQVDFYQDGGACSPTDFLKQFVGDVGLAQALEYYEATKHTQHDPTPSPTVVPLTLLPSDVQAMAGNLSNQQINTLFEKLTRQLPQGSVLAEAQQFIHEQATLDWTRAHTQAVLRLMSAIGAPDPSALPTFATVRDAYSVHRRLQRKPDRTLLADEDNLRRLLPNALDYQPIYAGRGD